METISWDDFAKIAMHVGEIVTVEELPEARKPAFKLQIHFGDELGTRRSCAQVTHYGKEELVGKQVVCVLNFPPKKIATAVSEVLVLGVPTANGQVALLCPDFKAVLGAKVY